MLVEAEYILDQITLRGVRRASERPPLLFLHGVTRRWQTFLPLLPAFAVRWDIHAIDHRGHGRSDRTEGGYRIADYVHDASRLVETFDRPVVLYGHSLGAMTAAGVAAACPKKVAAIVLEDPPYETMGARLAETSWLSYFRGLRPFAGDVRPVAEVVRDLAEVRIGAPGTETFPLGALRDATALRFTAWCAKRLDGRALDAIIDGRWTEGYDADGILAAIRCPVLVLQADVAAGGMLVNDDVRRIEGAVRDVSRIRFPGAGHVLHWQKTEEVVRHTTAFLETLDDG